jgi:hypothetical protein
MADPARRRALLERLRNTFLPIVGSDICDAIMSEGSEVTLFLSHANSCVRSLALQVLSFRRAADPGVLRQMLGIARHDPDEYVRRVAMLAISSAAVDRDGALRKVFADTCLDTGQHDLVRKTAYYCLMCLDLGSDDPDRVPNGLRIKCIDIMKGNVRDFDVDYIRGRDVPAVKGSGGERSAP